MAEKKKPNPIAKTLRKIRPQIVKSKKGKGSYKRKKAKEYIEEVMQKFKNRLTYNGDL